ncbi:hypothetical protein DFQ29_006448 [Apophysomyces sp. BC1021]|nr:hypothetical protein DFQ29_006448 [Apophysomyces sp. BC1021]
MPPLTKRQKIARKQKRSSSGGVLVSAVVEEVLQQETEEQERSDFEILAIFEADSAQESISEINTHRPIFPIALKDKTSSSRGQYWGVGRTTKLYQERRAEEKGKSSKKITEFFAPQKGSPEGSPDNESGDDEVDCFPVLDDETSTTIQTAFDRLTVFVTPQMNAVNATAMGLSDYEMAKYRGVHAYFRELLSGKKKMEASKLAAQIAWAAPSQYYRAAAIRFYAKEYLRTGSIPLHQQGKHSKRQSLLSDEEVFRRINNGQ